MTAAQDAAPERSGSPLQRKPTPLRRERPAGLSGRIAPKHALAGDAANPF